MKKIKQQFLPYTYLIGWTKLKKYYYGAEFGNIVKNAHPDNLWKTYFTSSKEVMMLRIYYGEPDIIQIRKTFKTKKQCWQWEQRVLKRLNVIYNGKWINKTFVTDNRKFKFKTKHSVTTKQKISDKCKQTKKWAGENNPGYGMIWVTKNQKNIRILPNELNYYILNGYSKGMFKSEETRKKMSNFANKRPRGERNVFIKIN